nr:uncharacterized protein LOC112709255 [Arachis hypogaea]
MIIFYEAISEIAKKIVDHFAGDFLYFIEAHKEADELIEIAANNQHLYSCEEPPVRTEDLDLETIAVPPAEIYNAPSDMSGNYPQGDTHIHDQCTPEQVHPYRAFIESLVLSGNAIEHALTKEKEPQVDSSLGVQEELVITTEHAIAKMKEPQEIPFLGMQKEPEDEQLAHFLATLKKLQVNISFAEVLEKKTPYTACLNGILFEKKDLRGDETMVLTKECSALVQNELPRNMPYPGSFQILCTTGKITLDKALYDLGLSLNLIPSSVMKKLRIQEVQATRITLQINDQSLRQAHEPVENVLVKV